MTSNQVVKEKSNLGFLVTGALEFGGDPVANVTFTNGDVIEMNAGQGGSLGVGLEYKIPSLEQLRLRGTIGIKYLTTPADNVHIRLTRIPVNLSANWVFNDAWRVGVGLASHQNISLNFGGLDTNAKLNSNTGPVFEFAYKWIGISYTAMQYSLRNETYLANAFGITFSGVVPFNK